MKVITGVLAALAISFSSLSADAQKIKTTEGDVSALKSESSVNIEFTYDNISVGKFAREEDYIKKKTEEYNSKEPGRGDTWAKSWINDRQARYEPKFIDLFTLNSGMTVKKDAKYTMIFKTKSIEPGYNIAGGMMIGGRKNAQVDAELWIVETADRTKTVALISVENAPGGTWGGYDYDTGTRIAESYAISGKRLGKYIK
ncbi:MAG TPA: hypothetical protein VK489_15705 [Ferruginibacter sp.]|nr:hypothetical protein [Ferruginibacter sp.]